MTTIACNLEMIVGDSLVSHDDIGTGAYLGMKLHRIGNSIFGEAGEDCSGIGIALDWLRMGKHRADPPYPIEDSDWNLLELAADGIFVWDTWLRREPVYEPNMAIGSGRKVALYCMRVLKYDPLKAVAEAAKVDHHTRAPFHVERLSKKPRRK